VDKGGAEGAGTLSSSKGGDSKKDYNHKVYVGGLVEVLN
jgi:hypothetical protein